MERLRPSLTPWFRIKRLPLTSLGAEEVNEHWTLQACTVCKRITKEVLPGTEVAIDTKKAFLLALVQVAHVFTECIDEDDRDHYGKKRLDLAGPLLGGLFRMLFRKLTRMFSLPKNALTKLEISI